MTGFFVFIVFLLNQGFMVQPDRIEVEVAGGQVITKRLIVTNISPDTLFMRVHIEEFNQDTNGKTLFSMPHNDTSVLINPVEFNIPPGDNYSIRISFKIPYDMPNEHWGMIIFSQIPPPLEKYSAIKFVREIGVPYYLVPIGAMGELDIDTSFIKNDSVFFRLTNGGLRHIRAKGILKIEKVGEGVIKEDTIKGIFLLPEHHIYRAFPLKKFKNGMYVARFKVDFGGSYVIEGVKSFKK